MPRRTPLNPAIGQLVGFAHRTSEGIGRVLAVGERIDVAEVDFHDRAEQPTGRVLSIAPLNVWHVPTPEELAAVAADLKAGTLARKLTEQCPSVPYVPAIRELPPGWVQFATR